MSITDLNEKQQIAVYQAIKLLQEALGYDGTKEVELLTYINDKTHNNIISLGFHQQKANKHN